MKHSIRHSMDVVLVLFALTMLMVLAVMLRLHLFSSLAERIMIQAGVVSFFVWGIICSIRLML
jgi:hypothetical protein